jgi:hypothetical protein
MRDMSDVRGAASLAREAGKGAAAQAFSPQDRKLMLATTGVGLCMVQRLEDAGFTSIAQMRALGAQRVVTAMCEFVGDDAWANRRRAIQRVLDQLQDADVKAGLN